ncbi:hypothetical protein O181_012272 [Austropuccinia psidii MF-1]|uniref:Uncharacterized protein n=1 Tax=Austropuccinia psidii MF-1 TaxID=1389203 RepID=A0A9Q3GMV4_9BASI|nr:hypothetical protein [Austropuccinia psidii MF-1]
MIPNSSITPITPNATDKQILVSEGPGITPGISSNLNTQLNFSHDFLLNPGGNPIELQDSFGKSQQPSLNIPSGSQAHVGYEKQVDDMEPKGKTEKAQVPIEVCDEIYASSTLVNKEKVTGIHHPYTSKPRMGHASSSREKIMDDEDENMSPTQSKQMVNQGGTASRQIRRAPVK